MEQVALQRLVIVIPVFNDWASIGLLLPEIDRIVGPLPYQCEVLLVDDGSETSLPPDGTHRSYEHLRKIEVLHLRKNLGHQRAIALGLFQVYECGGADVVVVMDADGEDCPEHIPILLDKLQSARGAKVVFAARTKRLESFWFRLFYRLYRSLHLFLTGIHVRVGNFSAVPARYLTNLLVSSDLWNHYAAAVIRARIPVDEVPLPRGKRLTGRSTMNFTSLVVHGFSAMSVFSDIISVRLLALAGASAVVVIGLAAAVIGVRFFTEAAVPGWATSTLGILLALLMQLVLLCAVLVFLVISGRDRVGFLLVRDGRYFLGGVTSLYCRE
jgi:hypothetical protein